MECSLRNRARKGLMIHAVGSVHYEWTVRKQGILFCAECMVSGFDWYGKGW
jgi:hypothetical protein